MRLGRATPAESAAPTPADVSFGLNVAILVRDGAEGYGRLIDEFEATGANLDLRAAALTWARRIAAYSRLGLLTSEQLHANVDESLWPDRALGVLLRLEYALVALAHLAGAATLLTDHAELYCDPRASARRRRFGGPLRGRP